MKTDINKIAKTISKLGSSEINELSTVLMDYNIVATIYRFGVEPKTNIRTIFMSNAGNKKLMIVKVLKEHLGLGLREAKNIVDSVPCVILEDVCVDEMSSMIQELEEAGATIELY